MELSLTDPVCDAEGNEDEPLGFQELRDLAYTCRRCLRLAEPYFYRVVCIKNRKNLYEEGETVVSKLARTLRKRPELGEFCRRVTLSMAFDFWTELWDERNIRTEQWLLAARILSYLPNVERLEIDGKQWGGLPSNIWAQLLQGVAGMKRLTEVTLGEFSREAALAKVFASNWGVSVKKLSLKVNIATYGCETCHSGLLDFDNFSLRNVTSLALRFDWNGKFSTKMVENWPVALEELTYNDARPDGFRANADSHKDTLRALTVPYRDVGDGFPFGDFSNFPVLEHLTLGPVYMNSDCELEPITEDQVRRILAPKLKRFTWMCCDLPWYEQVQWLRDLAEAAIARQASLNEIHLFPPEYWRGPRTGVWEEVDELNHEYQERGIKFTYDFIPSEEFMEIIK